MKLFTSLVLLLLTQNHFAQDTKHLSYVLDQLNLEKSQCKFDLIVSKVKPNYPDETIVVIPEIVTEDEYYFELNSHVVVIDSKTGTIKSSYFESSETNEWFSDAIRFAEISIDTAPYNVTPSSQAFGVKVRYVGSSLANPYEKETISLYIEQNDGLTPILKNFTVKQYNGIWDTNCAGEFIEQNKILILTATQNNNFYNILVKNTISTNVAFLNENEECIETETILKESQILKFKDGCYQHE